MSLFKKEAEKQLSKDGESATQWEIDYMKRTNNCPRCEKGKLIAGPSAGLATNFRCHVCGQGYNIVQIMGDIDNIGIDKSCII